MFRLLKANKKLEKYVEEICENRDESHNEVHMRSVRNNTIRMILWEYKIIWQWPLLFCLFMLHHLLGICNIFTVITGCFVGFLANEYIDKLRLTFIACTVAWLHDVADHKFNNAEMLRNNLQEFIDEFTVEYSYVFRNTKYEYLFNTDKIMAIIDRISFSREKMTGDADWYNTIGCIGVEIRNIVSDADKLEAIGKKGIIRCVQYTVHKMHEKKEHVDRYVVIEDVVTHYNEKLKLIAISYMRTKTGKYIAKNLVREMDDMLNYIQNSDYIEEHIDENI